MSGGTLERHISSPSLDLVLNLELAPAFIDSSTARRLEELVRGQVVRGYLGRDHPFLTLVAAQIIEVTCGTCSHSGSSAGHGPKHLV